MVGRGERREPASQKRAKLPVNSDADFAVGAVTQVNLEIVFLVIAEGTIEEKVDHTFHIVTEHHCFPSAGKGAGYTDLPNLVAEL